MIKSYQQPLMKLNLPAYNSVQHPTSVHIQFPQMEGAPDTHENSVDSVLSMY